MKLRILTHAEKDLRDTMPHLWPAFMDQDPIVSTFWPRLYEVYADFQLWVLDGKTTVANACTLPVAWDGLAEPRGLDWAMTNGAAGPPTTLCAVVVNIAAVASRHRPRERPAAAHEQHRRRARARRPDRAGAPDVEGALSADADRALSALAARGRAARTTRGSGRTSASAGRSSSRRRAR